MKRMQTWWVIAVCCTTIGAITAIGGQGGDCPAEAATRWRIADGGKRIVWDVARDARLPHGDRFEMSGLRASLIFSYDVAGDRSLALGRKVVWPAYRVQPNNTHGSFTYKFSEKKVPRLTADDAARAAKMSEAIERHFGCDIRGFHTYRYYEGCKVLRSWIGIPLCMGIYDRSRGTTDALFSPALWTGMGMLCAEGDKKGVTWDRSVLYAFRGVFAAGLGDGVMDKFLAYSRSRLLGEHVPYPVEAWPEGGKRHLSAESALYCRIVTEGLFGINPTGLGTFDVKPHLPKGVKRMSLKNIRAFGRVFDIVVDGTGTRIVEDKK